MSKLLLFVLLFSKDTIITTLAPPSVAGSPHPTVLRIVNHSGINLKNLVLEWSLLVNGTITRKGKTAPVINLPPNKPAFLSLPLRLPDDTAGEAFLQLSYHSAGGLTLDEQQLLVKPWHPRLTVDPAGDITVSDVNDIFTIRSPIILISFNRQTGWLIHYEIKGITLLDDTLGLRSNFWWPGYNDSAKLYAAESTRNRTGMTSTYTITTDSGWLAATRQPHLQLFSNTTSSDLIIIRTEYTLPATACLLHLSYTINAGGEMLITQQVEPDTTQPPPRAWRLPCFGMQWILPPGYDSITEYGPLARISHDHPAIPTTTDPNPRATATHTGVRWWTVTDKDGNGLQFIADSSLLDESALHSLDSDMDKIPLKPISRPQIQISIDRPAQAATVTSLLPAAQASPATPPAQAAPPAPTTWPILLPMGNYLYTYKVKPLVNPTHH